MFGSDARRSSVEQGVLMGGRIHPRGVRHCGLPDENTRHTRRTVEPVSSAIVRIDASLQGRKIPYRLLLLSRRREPRGLKEENPVLECKHDVKLFKSLALNG